MNERTKRSLKIGIPFITIVTLVLSSALPVIADSATKPVPAVRLVQGEVVSLSSDNSTIVVQNGNHAQVTITVDANTKYFIVPREKPSPVPTDNVADAT